MKLLRNALIAIVLLCVLLSGAMYLLAQTQKPSTTIYGMSFSETYAQELGLDWKVVYEAILSDLQVKHLRLSAYWPVVEPLKDTYDFTDLDYQIRRAHESNADVILAVGRRLPRWPECHIPPWAAEEPWDEKKKDILAYLTAVVERYKNDKTITYWQVENEPFLTVFAPEQCGPLDESFLKEEITLVHSLDKSRPVLVTDSGNLGKWFGAYRSGDAFGTSVYIYFWNPQLGQFRTVIPAWFYRFKQNVLGLLYGKKEVMLIELSGEPWLVGPIEDTDLKTQFSRMDVGKFNEIVAYAQATHLEKQYLWGAEWWYWLKGKGHPEMWENAKILFTH